MVTRLQNSSAIPAPSRHVARDALPTLPAPAVCEQARRSRDSRFDGLFFTGVPSTGVYCRPVCPAPFAKRVRYFGTAPAAEAAGFRPCLRCRPELSPRDGTWQRGDQLLARALKLIDSGALADSGLPALAEQLEISERQLRRIFVERLGAPPIAVLATRRLLFAKQLLTETNLAITEIALAAGFGSLRRFNAAFLAAYRMAPRVLRKERELTSGQTLRLRLAFRPPYDFAAMLAFLRARTLTGIEIVDSASYLRVIAADGHDQQAGPGWLRVSAWPGDEHALALEVHGIPPARLLDVVGRVRRMLDLDADPVAIAQVLGADPVLAPLLEARPGMRLPSGWDGFEIAVRAIVGQQVSVAAARTVASRLAARFGAALDGASEPGLAYSFPTPAALASADLSAVGLTRSKAATIKGIAQAVLDGTIDFVGTRTLDETTRRWVELPGIGPWTAQYIALRALGHPDAFPAEDLVLRREAAQGRDALTARALLARADRWRPWRAYAATLLGPPAAAASRGLPARAGPPDLSRVSGSHLRTEETPR
jgi:AraC family transcriptional regulator of adaptative response / DNA-3-methyladenine glycosylase II